jgi:hypothetical protein
VIAKHDDEEARGRGARWRCSDVSKGHAEMARRIGPKLTWEDERSEKDVPNGDHSDARRVSVRALHWHQGSSHASGNVADREATSPESVVEHGYDRLNARFATANAVPPTRSSTSARWSWQRSLLKQSSRCELGQMLPIDEV